MFFLGRAHASAGSHEMPIQDKCGPRKTLTDLSPYGVGAGASMDGVRNLPLALTILAPAEGWTAPRWLPRAREKPTTPEVRQKSGRLPDAARSNGT